MMCPLEAMESTILVGYCQAASAVIELAPFFKYLPVPTSMFGTLFQLESSAGLYARNLGLYMRNHGLYPQ